MDDEDFFDQIDEYGPQALAPRPTSGVAIAAAVLGALGVGALLSVAVLEFTGSPTPTQTVVVPGATYVPGPATPQAAAPTAAVPAPAPAPAPAVAAPRRAAPATSRVVIPSGSGAPANAPVAGSDAGPAVVDVPVDAGPPPAGPPPSVILNVPPVPQVPAVPQLPGVPPVPARAAGTAGAVIAAGVADADVPAATAPAADREVASLRSAAVLHLANYRSIETQGEMMADTLPSFGWILPARGISSSQIPTRIGGLCRRIKYSNRMVAAFAEITRAGNLDIGSGREVMT